MPALISDLPQGDLVIALICGGGPSLLPTPAHGLMLADEMQGNQTLLASGAPILSINIKRKHLFTVKTGGGNPRPRGVADRAQDSR